LIAVLLAAGVGRRLGHDRPKALLDVGGKTLLARHLENLAAMGLPCRVVSGFMADTLGQHLVGVETVHNEAFRRGSLLSLRCGLEGLDEDVVIMDADVLYDPTILGDVIALERGFAIDPRTDPGDEEMMIGYEAALDSLVGEHGADYALVAGRPWTEIDFPEDLERAAREILPLLG